MGDPGVGELGRPAGMVHEVGSTRRGFTPFPAWKLEFEQIVKTRGMAISLIIGDFSSQAIFHFIVDGFSLNGIAKGTKSF